MLFQVSRNFPTTAPSGFTNGKDTMIVEAESSADAIKAATLYSQLNDAPWLAAGGAVATQLTGRSDMSGIELRAVVGNASGVPQLYSYLGIAGDTLTTAVAGLTAVMNADVTTFPSGVTASGLVITIASGNNLGAQAITSGFFISPPNSFPALPGIVQPTLQQTGIPFVGGTALTGQAPAVAPYNQYAPTVNATGAAGIARTITFKAGTFAGYRFRLQVADPTQPLDYSVYFGDSETWALLATRFVALLNAIPSQPTTHATYGAGVITIPGATDAQGAKVITATITSPDGVAETAVQPAVNAAGISSIDRTITLSTTVLPLPRLPVLSVAAAVNGFVTG